MRKSNQLLLTAFCSMMLFFGSVKIDGQISPTEKEKFDSPTSPFRCEEWHLYIGETFTVWNKESALIIIARLGDGEFSRKLNLKRIKTLKTILKSSLKNDIIFVEGERVDGYGVIELYVKGKLFYSLPLRKKEDIAEGCQSV